MPADEVGEDEECHALGDLGVVGVPCVRAADGAVHLEVAAHEDGEGDPVGQHEEDDVAQAEAVVRLEGQAYRELAVVRHADERQDSLRGKGRARLGQIISVAFLWFVCDLGLDRGGIQWPRKWICARRFCTACSRLVTIKVTFW